VALAAFAPSPDGKHVAYALSEGGADWMTVLVRDLATGRLVMKNRMGEYRPVNADRVVRTVDVAFSSLHSSSASITTRHGGNSNPGSSIRASRGSTISFANCIDVNADCRSMSLRIASDTRSCKSGCSEHS